MYKKPVCWGCPVINNDEFISVTNRPIDFITSKDLKVFSSEIKCAPWTVIILGTGALHDGVVVLL